MYKWDSNLETGYEEIDSQHKQLFSALNNMIEAFKIGEGKEEIAKTVEFLINYTVNHFSAEENLMISYAYSYYPIHLRYHEDFKVMVKDLTRQLVHDGPSKELADEIIVTLRDWLVNHIQNDDFHMAAYIKSRKNAGK